MFQFFTVFRWSLVTSNKTLSPLCHICRCVVIERQAPNVSIESNLYSTLPTKKNFSNTKFSIPLSNLKNFLEHQILYSTFQTYKSFSNIMFCILLFRLGKLSPTLNFVLCLFQLIKFSSAPIFLYYFPISENFVQHRTFYATFPIQKSFSNTKFSYFCPFQLIKFSSAPNFLYYFSDLKNFFQQKIFDTTLGLIG